MDQLDHTGDPSGACGRCDNTWEEPCDDDDPDGVPLDQPVPLPIPSHWLNERF